MTPKRKGSRHWWVEFWYQLAKRLPFSYRWWVDDARVEHITIGKVRLA